MITNIFLGAVLLIALYAVIKHSASKHKIIIGDKNYVTPKTEETNSEQIN
jgi:hypothetical protein